MNANRRNVAVLLIAGLVLGAGAYAWAEEQPPDPSVSQEGGAEGGDEGTRPDSAKRRRPHFGAHGAIHGELIVPDGEGGYREVILDRGQLAVDGEQITVTRPDGETVTRTLTDDTRYRGVASASEVRPGEPGIVVADATGNALVVAQPTEEQKQRIHRFRQGRGNGNENGPGGVPNDEGQAPAA